VRHSPEELVFQPVRLLRFGVELLAFERGTLPLGQVANHFREALQFSRRLANRRHDFIAPESGAVLPDPPAFTLRASRGIGRAHLLLRRAPLQVFGRKKMLKCLPMISSAL
jgi:hypothetical protein